MAEFSSYTLVDIKQDVYLSEKLCTQRGLYQSAKWFVVCFRHTSFKHQIRNHLLSLNVSNVFIYIIGQLNWLIRWIKWP